MSSGKNIGFTFRYWFIMGFSWRIPVFINSLSKVRGNGSFGSNGFVFNIDRSKASISTIIPVRFPAANFILPLPASSLNSALKRVAGSASISFVGLQVTSYKFTQLVEIKMG